MRILEKARVFATAAHTAINQRRKYTNEPYINHPARVAYTVAAVPGSTVEMVAAAWLHDTVEDTAITHEDLVSEFGAATASLVRQVTDVSIGLNGNRAYRKALDSLHLFDASAEAQTIKLADIIDNTESILEHDPKFARVYCKEISTLLDLMHKGDPRLWRLAWNSLPDNATELIRN